MRHTVLSCFHFQHLRHLSYSDDEKIDLMRMSVPPSGSGDSPECRDNISAAPISPESFEGSDIIPFYGSEYEEIGENDLMFSYAGDSDADENSCRSAIEKHPELLSGGSMEAGLDSALGRSVSNPSLHLDTSCPVPTLSVTNTEPNSQPSRANGVLDFGYSSEGHSNEEPENLMAGKHGTDRMAADKTLGEEAVLDMAGPDSAGTSGIGTNTVHRSGFYRITDVSINESAASSPAEPRLRNMLHREPVGEETDDDFSRLNDLPLDYAPSASELDLLAKLGTQSGNNCQSLVRIHGRSLDSLAPLGSDKLFSVEKRVSSVEIIVDSVGSSSRVSVSSQISRDSMAENGDLMTDRFLLPASGDGFGFSAPSSCDASSEGTLSDSDISDLGTNDGTAGSPSKSRSLAKRVRRSVRNGLSKASGSNSIKSPTKRRMENLAEIPMAAIHMTRSTSDSAIYSNGLQLDCSGMKRSKICHSSSDLLDPKFPRKVTSSRKCRSDVVFPRKVPLRRSVRKLNFVEDITDDDDPHLSAFAAAYKSVSESQYHEQLISQQSTGMYSLVAL